MTVANDTSCICTNCKTDLKKMRNSQVNVHLYIDNVLYPGLSDYIKYLKSKNKLTKIFLESLNLYLNNSRVDSKSINKSISRIESILDISSDKALCKSLTNELNVIKASIIV